MLVEQIHVNIPHLFLSRRWWNIIEESWDGKVQWRGKGTVYESGGAATVKISKIASLIKTEAIAETNSLLRAAGNIVAEMVGYKNKEMKGDRQPDWRRRNLKKQKVLRKELG